MVRAALPGRFRRALAATAKALGLALVFVVAGAGGVLLHAGMTAPRTFVVASVNRLLLASFQGEVRVSHVEALSLVGARASGVDIEVWEPSGARVLVLRGVRARIEPLALARSLFSGSRLVVVLAELRVAHVDVLLEEDDGSELALAQAFASPEPGNGEASTLDLSIRDAVIEHVTVHSKLAAAPTLEADLENVTGSFRYTEEATEIEVRTLDLDARGLGGLAPHGTLTGSVRLPEQLADATVTARFQGTLGAVAMTVTGALKDRVVEAVADIPETAPAAFNALAPGTLGLGAPVSAHVVLRGELHEGGAADLRPRLSARVGASTIELGAVIVLPEAPDLGTAANVDLHVRGVDLSQLDPRAPPSDLTATLSLSLLLLPGELSTGTFRLESQAGTAAGELVPAASVWGEISERALRAAAHIAEPGAPTDVLVTLLARGERRIPSELSFETDTRVADLAEVGRLANSGRGTGHLWLGGRLDLDNLRLVARGVGEVGSVAIKGAQLQHGIVRAAVDGSLVSPDVRADLEGERLNVAGYGFFLASATATGSVREIAVTAKLIGDYETPSVSLRGRLSGSGASIGLHAASAEISYEREQARVKLASLRVAGGTVELRGLMIEGLGAPVVVSTATLSNGRLSAHARAADVDLARVARLLVRKEDIHGHLAFDVDGAVGTGTATGRLEVHAWDLGTQELEGLDIALSASGEGRVLAAKAKLAAGDAGRLELTATEIELSGPWVAATSWANATGRVSVRADIDLSRSLALIPPRLRPLAMAAGTASLELEATRARRGAQPSIELSLQSQQLELVGNQALETRPDGSIVPAGDPWRSIGLDATLNAKLAPDHRSQLTLAVRDAHGALANLDAKATLPALARIFADPRRVLTSLARDLPIEAHLDVPRRQLRDLPEDLGPSPVDGQIELSADFSGTVRDPRLSARARGFALQGRGTTSCGQTLDLDASVAYDGRVARLLLGGASADHDQVVTVDARVRLAATELAEQKPLDWDASADIALEGLELGMLEGLVHVPLGGTVSGAIKLVDVRRAASLEARLDVKDLAINGARFQSGNVALSVKEGRFNARARVDQADGYGEIEAKGALTASTGVVPGLDPKKPLDVALRAQNFRVVAIQPLVEETLSELDGRVDTDTTIHIEPGGRDGSMSGAIVIRDGVFELPQMGERFHAVRGRVLMKPWGTVRFDDFYAEAPTGKVSASATAELDGLRLRTAKAKLVIAKGESIPIAVEGVPMGRAFGEVNATASMSRDGKRLDIDVDVPMLRVDLPQSTGNTPQPLDPDAHVRIGFFDNGMHVAVPLAKPESPQAPSELVIRTSIKLGRDVSIKRDTTLAIVARGKTVITVSDKARVSGQIRLVSGKLELQGKLFTIDRGTINFVGEDAADPLVLASAYWDAPDKTRVFAEFSGHVTSGKLTLRSEPALGQEEILALVMFGSVDGSLGASSGQSDGASAGVGAVGVAGGVVTQGLNRIISGITTADITTRVDSSEANSPRPEIAVQITNSIAARLSYKLGVPAPGDNPDRAELTFDWRFAKNWSVSAVVGDQGSTSTDIVWRLRY